MTSPTPQGCDCKIRLPDALTRVEFVSLGGSTAFDERAHKRSLSPAQLRDLPQKMDHSRSLPHEAVDMIQIVFGHHR